MTINQVSHSSSAIVALKAGTHSNPHSFLGMHLVEVAETPQPTTGTPDDEQTAPTPATVLVVRAFFPNVERVTVVEAEGQQRFPLELLDEAGIFGGVIPDRFTHFNYYFELQRDIFTWQQGDPYRFLPTIGELDLHLITEGNHFQLYNILGAHPRQIEGIRGVSFAVWAPNARGVSLVGDGNSWHDRSLPMRSLGSSGIWEIFIPGLESGTVYKYAIRGADNIETLRADPVGFQSELRPQSASIVADLDHYQWADEAWITAREQATPTAAPMSIYEVHLGSWQRHSDGRWLTYDELGDQLISYATNLGFTHLELLPVSEHPYDPSWGYQITGFYAATSRFGTPAQFQRFVDRCHQAGLGIILDWVPAHFAVDLHGLAHFDGTFLYEPDDWRRRTQPDWGTFSFNYGRNEVRNFLLANALFWVDKYHIDGLRVDAVSAMLYLDYSRKDGEWSPNQYGGREHLEAIDFLRAFNSLVHEEGRGAITIAEESTAWPGVSKPVAEGGLGFNFKWDMGWMHDTLDYLRLDPLYRRYEQQKLTFRQMYAYTEQFILALSHDEVVHLKRPLLYKMPGNEWQQFANLRLLLAYQHAQPGKKLLFMGGELGQRQEWNHDTQIDWPALKLQPHRQIQQLVKTLNHLHRDELALHSLDHDPEGFAWLDFHDADHSIISFIRRGYNPNAPTDQPYEYIVCVFNFTPVPHVGYRIPVPEATGYRELLNTNASEYGGEGMGNLGRAQGEPMPHGDYPNSMAINLPPLAAVFFKPEG